MTTETDITLNGREDRAGTQDLIIDCDVHHGFRSLEDLAPYLSPAWQARVGLGRSPVGQGRTAFALPWGHFTKPHGGMRLDALSPEGGPPGSDPEFVARQLFDEHGIGAAILNSGDLITLGGMAFPDLATALASAVNQWTIDRWFSADPRFLGALVVAPQDPAAAAREIRLHGEHPRMVQVLISSTGTRLGNRIYHPIYEAAAELGLPIAWHLGSESSGINGSLTAGGPPTSYIEGHTSLSQIAQAQVTSMVCEGVFEKFPDLKFVVMEGGVAWLPHLMWRMDRLWQATQDELPWLRRAPSEYIRDHVRLTTQPLEEPPDRRDLGRLLDTVDGESLLLYASDYPHWDFDNPATTLRHFSPEARHKIFYETALGTYPRLAGLVAPLATEAVA
jgi:predicted TIM-barrel fold metal-dependent hydrolase